jgi:soluble lytic murein transglycosylase-like protein
MMTSPGSPLLKIAGTVGVLLVLMLGVHAARTPEAAPVATPVRAPVPVAAPAVPASAPVATPLPDVPPPLPVSASQAAVARWVGAKYRVAPEAIAPLVAEADKLSATYRLSPQLLIAVMAIESNFHPYIQSEAGAQGLMQVMPTVHAKRYEKFGGKGSFVDPIVSLKVGAEILHDCVKLRGGSETEALRFYFGGGAASDTYIDKVRAEQRRLVLAAGGGHPPVD